MKWTNPGHQLDRLGEQLLKVKNLYIYGVDEKAEKTYKVLQWLKIADEFNISFVLDITVINQGGAQTFCGKRIVPFQTEVCDAFRAAPEECAIALPQISQTTERAMLEALNATNIFYLAISHNRRDNFIQNFVCVWLMYKKGELLSHWTNFVTTSKCNLNCKHCLNSNEYIISRRDVTFEEFKAHIDIVFSKFDYLYSLHFTGGEPQLVKELPRFIRYLKETYGDRIFEFFVITNGTIVPSEDLLAAAKSMDGAFLVDDYSNSVPTAKIKEIENACTAMGVSCNINKVDFWFDLDIENANYNKLSEEELERHKDACQSYLHEIAGGKIYACCYEEYANRAGIGTPDPDDCIDIAETPKMEILEFRQGYTRKGYVELCKHCRGLGPEAKKTAVAIQIPPAAKEISSHNLQPNNNEKALVSICVPIYNTQKYLTRCIKSLLNQSYRNLEIVLADDGSTDQSGLICDEYAKLDSRVIVKHKPNGGEASARNAALAAASGEYVMFIDSDDEYLPNAVRSLVDGIAKNNADLAIGGYLERTGDIERFATGHTRDYTPREIAQACLTENCVYGTGYINSTVNAKLFKRAIIAENNISFDERFVVGNDTIFMCDYLRYAKTIRDIFAPIYVYYKFDPTERVQGMNWHYPDGFFLFAYAADRMIKLAQPDNEELKRFIVKQYKDFFYAAVNAAANIDRFQDKFTTYFSSLCDDIEFLRVGAGLDLIENYIADEEGALPLRLISYLVVKRRYDELCELLQALSRTRGVVPVQGERVRPMIRLDKQSQRCHKNAADPESYPTVQFNFADDELLLKQISDMAIAISTAEARANEYEAQANEAKAKASEYKARAKEVETKASKYQAQACEYEARANEAEARANGYANSTSWRITEPLRKLKQLLK